MANEEVDLHWMRQALRAAAEGEGRVEPNPMVGCLLVVGEQQIGSGYHARFGGPHAEIVALEDARRRGNGHLLAKATAYVTLEPCCHQGKTPPCTRALLQSEVRRIVVAMADPFAEVQGRGIELLRQGGVQVEMGVAAEEAEELNAPYLKRLRKGLPWVIAKWAMSLDGRIATRSGQSQWISSSPSRHQVHRLRGRMDAVIVGSGTALADDPLLTARDVPRARIATRIVVDSRLRVSTESQLVRTAREIPCLVWTGPLADPGKVRALRGLGVDVVESGAETQSQRLVELLHFLAEEKKMTNVLIEGGSQLIGGLLDARLVDQCEVFVAPCLIGGTGALAPISGAGVETVAGGPRLVQLTARSTGADIHLSGRVRYR